jgi:hypothetical protein
MCFQASFFLHWFLFLFLENGETSTPSPTKGSECPTMFNNKRVVNSSS